MDGSIVIGIELEESGFIAALSRLRQAASQNAISALGSLNQALGSVTTALNQGAAAGNTWGNRLTGIFTQVRTSALTLAPSLQTAGATAGNRFVAGLQTADTAGAGRTLAQNAVNGFSSGNFLASGATAANLILQGLMSGAGNFTAGASSLAALIRSAFSGGWYSVGYNISSGIASGVRGGSSLITSAAISAAQAALAAAKRSLGVASPSKVFREEVGAMIPAGIAQGVEQGTDTALRSVRNQSRVLLEAARQDVVPVLPTLGRGSGEMGAGTSAVSGGAPVQLRLEAPLYLDGRELARATARYTGQQLLWEAM